MCLWINYFWSRSQVKLCVPVSVFTVWTSVMTLSLLLYKWSEYIFSSYLLPLQQEDCEKAYFKMDNVLIDDRRIHVDFSQSVAKIKWKGKGRRELWSSFIWAVADSLVHTSPLWRVFQVGSIPKMTSRTMRRVWRSDLNSLSKSRSSLNKSILWCFQ